VVAGRREPRPAPPGRPADSDSVERPPATARALRVVPPAPRRTVPPLVWRPLTVPLAALVLLAVLLGVAAALAVVTVLEALLKRE